MKEMSDGHKSSSLKKWGPLASVLGLGCLVVALLISQGDLPQTDPSAAAATTVTAVPGRTGVLSYSDAKKNGSADKVNWGERCDSATGVLKLPVSPAPGCFAPFSGDNGGPATAGVTPTSIKVVVWTAQENDPILSFVYRQIGNNDSGDDDFATYKSFARLFETYYETYGRRVELIRYTATGPINDPVTATTDAETIARDIKPFAVIGGPSFSDAFADTIAKKKILCINCGATQSNEWFKERGPYLFDIMKNLSQNTAQTIEYLGKRVVNRPAVHAGKGLSGKTRRLGLIYAGGALGNADLAEQFSSALKKGYSSEIVASASYDNPVSLAGQAREILARFKANGITTVLFAGDPLAPQTLTTTAQEQGYEPEWVITGSSLVDTTIFGRTYQQDQWKRAFGPSNLFARVSPTVAGAQYLHQWFYGRPPASTTNTPLILPGLQLLYGAIQGMGPRVTHSDFRDVVFSNPVIASTPISPQISWGDRGFWPDTDYSGLDDQTEVWWDPAAVGPDESGTVARGMWSYVSGGKRYLPGEWPNSAPQVFKKSGAVTLYRKLPPGVSLPRYQPLPPSN